MLNFKGLLTLFSILLLSWTIKKSVLYSSNENQSSKYVTSTPAKVLVNDDIIDLIPEYKKNKSVGKDGYQVKTIVIDAGHGGKDPGCSGRFGLEKEVTLGIAMRLGEKLKEKYKNEVKIIYTRAKDIFIPLYERADIANKANADLFISIHCNALSNPKIKGTETYVLGLHKAKENLAVAKRENQAILLEDNYQKNYDGYNPNAAENHIIMSLYQNAFLEQSIALAHMIEENFSNEPSRKSLGVKQAGFVVIRQTAMPSLLIESGFMTNAEEEQYLMSDHGQNTIANNIVDAIQNYKTMYETKRVNIENANNTSNDSDNSQAKLPTQKGPNTPKGNKNFVPNEDTFEKYYVVQFAVATKKLPLKEHPFSKISDIKIKFENNLYKYHTGTFKSPEEASRLRKELQSLGFKDAFVTTNVK
jgi:N-acetylmuramoyl-L-alanine amidase